MILSLIAGFALPAFCAVVFASNPWRCRRHGWHHHFWEYAMAGAGAAAVAVVLWTHVWWHLPGYLFWVAAGIWYFTRRRRKRAAARLGAKSRALRDALVRKTRELSQPRPVLQPIPVGTHA